MSDGIKIKVPPKIKELFKDRRGELRYRAIYGGRGSGKSYNMALMAALWGYAEQLRILCARELQNSIKESFHAEVKNAILSSEWLSQQYEVGVDYIRGLNGTEFIFKGLRHNATSIKSLAQIDLCIVEEAEDVPEDSWLLLEPTIRAEKSEIWVIWNPKRENSPTNRRFVLEAPPRAKVIKMDYHDNPYFPKVLEEQRKYAKRIMTDNLYRNIWEGDYLTDGGQLIKSEWLKYYEVLPKPFEYRMIFADTAMTIKEHSDYSVFQCWGLREGRIYLIDQIRSKWEAPELERMALSFWAKHKALEPAEYGALRQMFIENKASGTGLIQTIQRQGNIPIIGIDRTRDKVSRLNDVLGYFESGLIHIPSQEGWVNDFVMECESFSADMKHEYDDQIDPMIDAINEMLGSKVDWNNLI